MNLLAVAVSGRGLVDPSEPVFGAGDDALLRGRAVFETLRVYGGRPFLLDDHLERLRVSAERTRLPAPDLSACHELASLVVRAVGETELALRFYWTGTALVATCSAIDPALEDLRARGLRLALVSASRSALARAKSTSYAENMIAQEDAISLGADDALLVSEDRIVLEGSMANIWWRTGDRLFTPSLELPILAGVTRALMLKLSTAPIDRGIYPLEHLLAADEVFTTSSVREVMPVHAIGRNEFTLGPTAVALQAALRERARGNTQAAVDTSSIAPGRVLDLRLGMTPEAVQRILGDPQGRRGGDGIIFLEYPGIVVSLYDGVANMLIVDAAEIGATEAGAFAGMPFRELERLVGELVFGEGEGLWTSVETEGLWYEIARPSREGEEPIDPPLCSEVHAITDPERAVVRRIYVM